MDKRSGSRQSSAMMQEGVKMSAEVVMVQADSAEDQGGVKKPQAQPPPHPPSAPNDAGAAGTAFATSFLQPFPQR